MKDYLHISWIRPIDYVFNSLTNTPNRHKWQLINNPSTKKWKKKKNVPIQKDCLEINWRNTIHFHILQFLIIVCLISLLQFIILTSRPSICNASISRDLSLLWVNLRSCKHELILGHLRLPTCPSYLDYSNSNLNLDKSDPHDKSESLIMWN